MLIAISGAQGSGKSTTLDAVHKVLPESRKIIRKTSRSILSDWGVTLDEVNHNPELSRRFQDEITTRKKLDETGYHSYFIWLTERTYADLLIYTIINLGKHNAHTDWVEKYYEKCKRFQQSYDHVFYLTGGKFPIQNDGVRSINPSFGKLTDVSMKHFTEEITDPNKLTIITESDLKARTNIIVEKIKSISPDPVIVNSPKK